MVPGSKVTVADSGDYSITISVNKNEYFGIDKFIAKRVFVALVIFWIKFLLWYFLTLVEGYSYL